MESCAADKQLFTFPILPGAIKLNQTFSFSFVPFLISLINFLHKLVFPMHLEDTPLFNPQLLVYFSQTFFFFQFFFVSKSKVCLNQLTRTLIIFLSDPVKGRLSTPKLENFQQIYLAQPLHQTPSMIHPTVRIQH